MFVAKLSPQGNAFEFLTYLGGAVQEYPFGLTLDEAGNPIVTGWTTSPQFPTTAGAYDRTLNGGSDVFVTKLRADGKGLIASTLLGGSLNDVGRAVKLDRFGGVVVAGYVDSQNFPVTTGAFQKTLNGTRDILLARFSSDFAQLQFSTYLGGEAVEEPWAIALAPNDNVYLAGFTTSRQFPQPLPLAQQYPNGFVTAGGARSALREGPPKQLGGFGAEDGLVVVLTNVIAQTSGNTSGGYVSQVGIAGGPGSDTFYALAVEDRGANFFSFGATRSQLDAHVPAEDFYFFPDAAADLGDDYGDCPGGDRSSPWTAGWAHDPDQANRLLEEAGWCRDENGIWNVAETGESLTLVAGAVDARANNLPDGLIVDLTDTTSLLDPFSSVVGVRQKSFDYPTAKKQNSSFGQLNINVQRLLAQISPEAYLTAFFRAQDGTINLIAQDVRIDKEFGESQLYIDFSLIPGMDNNAPGGGPRYLSLDLGLVLTRSLQRAFQTLPKA